MDLYQNPPKLASKEEQANAEETWSKPEVAEQQIGLEVTTYAPAEVEAA